MSSLLSSVSGKKVPRILNRLPSVYYMLTHVNTRVRTHTDAYTYTYSLCLCLLTTIFFTTFSLILSISTLIPYPHDKMNPPVPSGEYTLKLSLDLLHSPGRYSYKPSSVKIRLPCPSRFRDFVPQRPQTPLFTSGHIQRPRLTYHSPHCPPPGTLRAYDLRLPSTSHPT